ncbi:hypothetical protein GR11A_00190 [Vibrio phage vB_VcorM_GR11A]|nr:hypothetical protein GR11A_00190 [Vibrio phage vB_VcorM_GR11A]
MGCPLLDIFEEGLDYPMREVILGGGGVPENALLSYVSSTYLNGLINHVEIVKAVVVQRYVEDDVDWNKQVLPAVNIINEATHSDLSECPDDIWILAKTESDWWVFVYDKDTSDCNVGRTSRDTDVLTEGKLLELLELTISGAENYEYAMGKSAELKLSGWIKG